MDVLAVEMLDLVGSKVCLDGNTRHAITHRTAQANTCFGEMTNCVDVIVAPEETALEHHEVDTVTDSFVELERVDDGESLKGQDFEMECENGGKRDWCSSLLTFPYLGGEDCGTDLDTVGSRSAL